MKSLFLIIGAPGSGKTTDAGLIAQNNENIAHYSTGELLRSVVGSGSELGKKIEEIISKGEIVPVAIALEAIINVIRNSQEEIVLVDGYPRSVEQMIGLDSVLKEQKDITLKAVIDVYVSDEVAKQRVLGRNRGVDDDIKVFENRLKVYYEPKEQIESFYNSQNLLHVINGERDIKTVVDEMEDFITKMI